MLEWHGQVANPRLGHGRGAGCDGLGDNLWGRRWSGIGWGVVLRGGGHSHDDNKYRNRPHGVYLRTECSIVCPWALRNMTWPDSKSMLRTVQPARDWPARTSAMPSS